MEITRDMFVQWNADDNNVDYLTDLIIELLNKDADELIEFKEGIIKASRHSN